MKIGIGFCIPLSIALISASLFAQNAKQTTPAEDLYKRGLNALMGAGPSRNENTSMDLLRRSAELGYMPAETAVAYAYETGFTVTADPQEAASWYRKAAQQGDPLAAWALGRLYYLRKIPGSYHDAEDWLGRAADAGDAFGQYLLGLSLHQRDSSKGVSYFQKAAEQGLPFAQYQLGIALQTGLGILLDKQTAYVWLLVSLDAGVQQASAPIQQLEAELGTTNVEKAKVQAREFEKTASRSRNAHGCTGWPGELDEIPAPPPIDTQNVCR